MDSDKSEQKDHFIPELCQADHLSPDLVMTKLGTYARYQTFVCFLSNFSWYIYAAETLIMVFITEVPPFYCNSTQTLNASYSNVTIFRPHPQQCTVGKNNDGEVKCGEEANNYVFDPEFGETLSSEWLLLCDNFQYSQMGSSIFMIGTMVTTLFICQLADRYGRRWSFMICCWLAAILSVSSAFSPSHTVFLVIRFLMGVAAMGVTTVGFVYGCEIVSPKFRPILPAMINAWFSISHMIVGLLAMYLKDWRPLTLATTAPLFITISFYWLIPESLYWLEAKNRMNDAFEWIKKASKLNGVQVNIEDCLILKKDEEDKETRHLGHVLRSKVLVFHIITFSFCGIAVSMVYWGLSMFSTKLASDRYTGYILNGLIEFPAALLSPLLLHWFGRRTIGFWSFLASGVALVAFVFVPLDAPIWITVSLALFGKFANILTWCSTFLLIPEALPTTVRNVTFGLVSTMGKIGSVVAPYVAILGEIDRRFPSAILGCFSLSAAVLHFCLPETRDKELPEDIDDADPGPFLKLFMKKEKIRG